MGVKEPDNRESTVIPSPLLLACEQVTFIEQPHKNLWELTERLTDFMKSDKGKTPCVFKIGGSSGVGKNTVGIEVEKTISKKIPDANIIVFDEEISETGVKKMILDQRIYQIEHPGEYEPEFKRLVEVLVQIRRGRSRNLGKDVSEHHFKNIADELMSADVSTGAEMKNPGIIVIAAGADMRLKLTDGLLAWNRDKSKNTVFLITNLNDSVYPISDLMRRMSDFRHTQDYDDEFIMALFNRLSPFNVLDEMKIHVVAAELKAHPTLYYHDIIRDYQILVKKLFMAGRGDDAIYFATRVAEFFQQPKPTLESLLGVEGGAFETVWQVRQSSIVAAQLTDELRSTPALDKKIRDILTWQRQDILTGIYDGVIETIKDALKNSTDPQIKLIINAFEEIYPLFIAYCELVVNKKDFDGAYGEKTTQETRYLVALWEYLQYYASAWTQDVLTKDYTDDHGVFLNIPTSVSLPDISTLEKLRNRILAEFPQKKEKKDYMDEIKYFMLVVAEGVGKTLLKLQPKSGEKKDFDSRKVTPADLTADRMIKLVFRNSKVLGRLPVLTEESHYEGEGTVCIVADPCDGSGRYSIGDPNFSVSLALRWNHISLIGVVNAPALEKMYYAQINRGAFLTENGKTKRLNIPQPVNSGLLRINFAGDTQKKEPKFYTDMVSRIKDSNFFTEVQVGGLVSTAIELCQIAECALDAYIGHVHIWDWAGAERVVIEAGGKVTHFKNGLVVASRADIHDKLVELIDKESNKK